MKVFTAHTRAASLPVLVPERFSWGAAVFGPFWLFAHRAWIGGAVALLLAVLATRAPEQWRWALAVALGALLGLFGHDLRRWSLARRGFLLAHIVAGHDQDEALARLLTRRPDLIERTLR